METEPCAWYNGKMGLKLPEIEYNTYARPPLTIIVICFRAIRRKLDLSWTFSQQFLTLIGHGKEINCSICKSLWSISLENEHDT